MGGYWEQREERINKALADGTVKKEDLERYLLPDIKDFNKYTSYTLLEKYNASNNNNNNNNNNTNTHSSPKGEEEEHPL